jgi:hypothetical protein
MCAKFEKIKESLRTENKIKLYYKYSNFNVESKTSVIK